MIRALTACALLLCVNVVAASPCSGVDRGLSLARRIELAPLISRHLQPEFAALSATEIVLLPDDILQSFRFGRWHVLYVNNHVSDEPYLFYRDDPVRAGGYVTSWAGAAARDEAPAIRRWLVRAAPGIPRKLAACFAWHVTDEPIETAFPHYKHGSSRSY